MHYQCNITFLKKEAPWVQLSGLRNKGINVSGFTVEQCMHAQ